MKKLLFLLILCSSFGLTECSNNNDPNQRVCYPWFDPEGMTKDEVRKAIDNKKQALLENPIDEVARGYKECVIHYENPDGTFQAIINNKKENCGIFITAFRKAIEDKSAPKNASIWSKIHWILSPQEHPANLLSKMYQKLLLQSNRYDSVLHIPDRVFGPITQNYP